MPPPTIATLNVILELRNMSALALSGGISSVIRMHRPSDARDDLLSRQVGSPKVEEGYAQIFGPCIRSDMNSEGTYEPVDA